MQKSLKTGNLQAEQIRTLCLQAALQAAEEAAMLGLCAEGQLQAALSAIETLDLKSLDTE